MKSHLNFPLDNSEWPTPESGCDEIVIVAHFEPLSIVNFNGRIHRFWSASSWLVLRKFDSPKIFDEIGREDLFFRSSKNFGDEFQNRIEFSKFDIL